MPDRPHVLLLLTDQQQVDALGAVDGSFRTPNLDGLADEGVLFTGCYTTHPQCSPARSSVVTGRFPHEVGMHTLPEWGPGPLDTGCPSVGRQFGEAGYETAYIGKWHLGEDNIHDLGWERTENVHETSNPPEGTPTDTTTRDRAIEYLSAYDGEDPFFLTVSFNLPHPQFYEDRSFADWYDYDEVPLPENFDGDFANKPDFHEERALECGSGEFLTSDEVREIRYKYRTMVSRVDDHVGRIIDELESQGLREETVVAFASDHGDMQGSHGLSLKGVVPYEEILRVPLVLDIPTRESRRARVPDLVSLADLPGTLLDAAGVSTDEFDGRTFLPAFERHSPPEDEHVFFEHKYAYWGEHPYRGVRTRNWKYIENLTDGSDELYHIDVDGHEMQNLSGDPEYEDQETRLGKLVRQWWDDTGGNEDRWTDPVER